MLLDERLLNVVRHELVAGELRGERSTATRQRTQCDGVAAELLQRNLSRQLLVTGL